MNGVALSRGDDLDENFELVEVWDGPSWFTMDPLPITTSNVCSAILVFPCTCFHSFCLLFLVLFNQTLFVPVSLSSVTSLAHRHVDRRFRELPMPLSRPSYAQRRLACSLSLPTPTREKSAQSWVLCRAHRHLTTWGVVQLVGTVCGFGLCRRACFWLLGSGSTVRASPHPHALELAPITP